jgi:hypothetical protein
MIASKPSKNIFFFCKSQCPSIYLLNKSHDHTVEIVFFQTLVKLVVLVNSKGAVFGELLKKKCQKLVSNGCISQLYVANVPGLFMFRTFLQVLCRNEEHTHTHTHTHLCTYLCQSICTWKSSVVMWILLMFGRALMPDLNS